MASRTVSRGSSASTVPVPTTTASAACAPRVAVRPRLGPGDPLARSVCCRDAPVEGCRELPRHERPAVADRKGPLVVQRVGLLGEQTGLDREARLPPARPPHRRRPGWGRPGRTRLALTPASTSACAHGPVRPLWAHGSRVTTAVAPRAREPAACNAVTSACAVPAPRCQPSPSTTPALSTSTAPTRGLGPRGTPGVSASVNARRIASRSASVATSVLPRLTWPGQADMGSRGCRVVLPSGLSPSAQEFHLVNHTLAGCGSRAVTAGSGFHRSPEHACADCIIPQRRQPATAGDQPRQRRPARRRRPSPRRTRRPRPRRTARWCRP